MGNPKLMTTDDPGVLSYAVSTLRDGGIAAIPTDTVYGLAADVSNGSAIAKLYEIKGRSQSKSIPVLLADPEGLPAIARNLHRSVAALAERFWPGPLTLVVRRNPALPSEVSSTGTIGVRVPDSTFARALLSEFGPLAVTSANRSGSPSHRTAGPIARELGVQVDLIVDGGPTPGGMASTVVDCMVDPPRLLREGPITLSDIHKAWGGY